MCTSFPTWIGTSNRFSIMVAGTKRKILPFVFCAMGTIAMRPHTPNILRPHLVRSALEKQSDLYYFGLGSNMLRSKVENRGINGSKIDIISMEASYVENHRLAFNMRGFPPVEPAMGSLEPLDDSSSSPILAYSKRECHGALIRLNATNYEKLMRSEGVHGNATRPGYEEVAVKCVPYDKSKPPVQAIALRARPHARLARDCSPSIRYMTLLRDGAAELGLSPDYQLFLKTHPVHWIPPFVRCVSLYNLYFNFSLGRLLRGWQWLRRFQSVLLFRVYAPSSAPKLLQAFSHISTSAILLPGCLCGVLCLLVRRTFKDEEPPMIKRLRSILAVAGGSNTTQSKTNFDI